MTAARSKQVRSASELTLIADIKQDFVEGVIDTVSYATRLRVLLRTLFELRRVAVEQLEDEYVGPLERLRTLHFVRYSIFDNDRRLLLAVSFDHSWESYMRTLVDNAGPLLDAIFCHCTDYEGFSCSRGVDRFSRWVSEHQITADFFYAGEPRLTVDDVRYLKAQARLDLSQGIDSVLAEAARLHVGPYQAKDHLDDDPVRLLKLLAVLRRTQEWYPVLGGGPHADRTFYDGTARALLWAAETLMGRIDELVGAVEATGQAELGYFRELAGWYRKLQARGSESAALSSTPDEGEVQGNILSPYQADCACMALVQCDGARGMRALLSEVQPDVTYEADVAAAPLKLNLALTAAGLKTLGLDPQERAAFPDEFQEGMDARAGVLGDTVDSHPEKWWLPEINWPPNPQGDLDDSGQAIPLGSVDAVVMLQSHHTDAPMLSEHDPLRARLDRLHALADKGVHILRVEPMMRDDEDREPFGFVDGLSQPSLPDPRTPSWDDVAAGELVMGYPDSRGEVRRYRPGGREVPGSDLFKDGSFLVLRKLKQDVSAFEALVDANVDPPEVERKHVEAAIMGRTTDGEPLIPDAYGDPTGNVFDYSKDSDAQQCPFHAHIRRANPRLPDHDKDELRELQPRIARRSMPYGAPGRGERGLMFMAYNASIANQYEVIQSWLNGGNSTGLFSGLADLLSGNPSALGGPYRAYINGKLRELKVPDKPWVELCWGMYLFVPGKTALARLAARAASPPSRPSDHERAVIERGERIIAGLARAGSGDQGRMQWKRVMEDLGVQGVAAEPVLAAIRARGGALATPYGVLVADADEVQRVLADHTTFSVREYYARLGSLAPLHLGMDPVVCPIEQSRREDRARDKTYEKRVGDGTYRDASAYNEAMYRIDEQEAFDAARAQARAWLDARAQQYVTLAAAYAKVKKPKPERRPARPEMQVALKELANHVMEQLSHNWFDLPLGLMDSLRTVSASTFRPHPESWVLRAADTAGKQIRDAFEKHLRKQLKGPPAPDLKREVDQRIGAVLGFTGPTTGTFLSVMRHWQQEDTLGRMKQWWDRQDNGAAPRDRFDPTSPDTALYAWLIDGMRAASIPEMLHRTALRPTVVGGVKVAAGDRVVASLASAVAQDPGRDAILFGGDYKRKCQGEYALTHACPGRRLAIGVLLGVTGALLDRPRPRFLDGSTMAVSLI